MVHWSMEQSVRSRIPPSPFGAHGTKVPPTWKPYSAVLTPGSSVTFTAKWYVEKWLVGVVAAAGVRVSCTIGEVISGDPVPFGGGGTATMPGNGPAITFLNTGATNATVVAIAANNMPGMAYSPGNLA